MEQSIFRAAAVANLVAYADVQEGKRCGRGEQQQNEGDDRFVQPHGGVGAPQVQTRGFRLPHEFDQAADAVRHGQCGGALSARGLAARADGRGLPEQAKVAGDFDREPLQTGTLSRVRTDQPVQLGKMDIEPADRGLTLCEVTGIAKNKKAALVCFRLGQG